ncbi:MAG: recombination mediator RecR, partial [Oscillospiraceae bacterium]|nr:recombination mediator RecR [Oscillospiraceae bacterium]
MRDAFPAAVEQLITQFARLPGVGRKSAARLAFYVLGLPDEEAVAFGQTVIDAKNQTSLCPVCQNLTDGKTCNICGDDARDAKTICVVSEPRDVAAIERAREYRGVYHVLHGVISPQNNKSPDDIRIHELLSRVNQGGISEVILATNPDTEGDTTALYIARLLQPFSVRVTRLAYGIPIGGHVEFA